MSAAGSSGAAAAAAHAVAIAKAIKASGAIVRVAPEDFMTILGKTNKPLVVMARGGFMKRGYHYLTGYKGLVFFTKAAAPLYLPGDAEIVAADKIWTP
ncbi:MAG: hypothetical protein HY670_12250 [Chloroflexi bacterium]|nr:hypothetical protein [Chloroflexota bacterium]